MQLPSCHRLWIVALMVTLSACAAVPSQPTPERPEATPPKPPQEAPQVAAPAVQDPLLDTLQKNQEDARRLEREGRLADALERWKIVLTIDPQDSAGRQKREELEARVREQYRQHLAAGKGFLQRRDRGAAEREFLAALRLDPWNREAVEQLYLTEEQLGEQTAFARPLRKGPAPAKVEASRPAPATPQPTEMAMPAEDTEEESGEEMSFAEAAELFRRGDYLAAIAAFSRVLVQQPGMREAIEYQKLAYYNQGVAYVQKENYTEALKMFEQVRRMQPNFKRVEYYTQTSREKLAEQHNLAGIRYFRDQKLKEAIAEWDEALALNPKLESARRSQDRAKRLLKSLEDIK